MAVSASKRKLQQERRESGLCIQCGAEANGKTRCVQCAAKAKESRRRAQAKKKALGICQNSGCKAKAMPGRTVCEDCSQKASEASLRRYYRNKEAGVCRYCGAKSGGKARCPDCEETFATYSQEWYKKRRDQGRCVNCATKLPDNSDLVLCQKCNDKKKEVAKERRLRLKLEALDAYGGPVCVGCGEDEAEILELDHVGGGGCKHRREIGQANTYLWMKQNGYPKGFRVLCPTCNKKVHRGIPLRKD